MIVLNKLPTFSDLETFNDSHNVINAYLYNDCMVYFSMLDYNNENIPAIYKNIDPKTIFDMKHLTNLEMVNIVTQKLSSQKPPIVFDSVQEKKDVTCMLSDIYPINSIEFTNIRSQIKTIAKKTINSIKYELRPLNRHDGFKSCFNLLAYDTLLDDTGKLWIIEINRGPDMVGLQYNIGYQGCYEMFDDIFKLSIDPHYNTSNIINPITPTIINTNSIANPNATTITPIITEATTLTNMIQYQTPTQSETEIATASTAMIMTTETAKCNDDMFSIYGVKNFKKLKIKYSIVSEI